MPDPPLLVEAAHILPFAEFHYDHPRNGIALCRNHHWGFDNGAFTIDDDYSVRYSSKLQNPTGFVVENKQIYLPSNPDYAPAPEALQWHRENRFVE
jgi:putative restriction endonuclease